MIFNVTSGEFRRFHKEPDTFVADLGSYSVT